MAIDMFAVVQEQTELQRLFDEFKTEMTAKQWDFSTYDAEATDLASFCGCFAGYLHVKNIDDDKFVENYWRRIFGNLDANGKILDNVLACNNVLTDDCSLLDFIEYFETFLSGLDYIINNNIDNPDRYSRQLGNYIKLFTQDMDILIMPYSYYLDDLLDFYVDYYNYQEYLTDNNEYHVFDNYSVDEEYIFDAIIPTKQKQILTEYELVDKFRLNGINWSVIKYED